VASSLALKRRTILGLALLSATLLLLAACGGEDSAAPTPTGPTPDATVTLPPFDTTITPTPLPPETAYRLIYREFGIEEDTIWKVLPSNPSDREQLAVIPHRSDWGIVPSLSPDGKRLAYVTFPENAIDRNSQAEAYVLDFDDGETRLVAEGVDLQFRPLWTPDLGLFYLRRIVQIEQDVRVLQVLVPPADEEEEENENGDPEPTAGGEGEGQDGEEEEPEPRAILQADISDILTFIPLGFADDDETMYFVQVQGGTGGGTLLGSYAPATFQAVATATAEAQATATAVVPTLAPPISPSPLTSFLVQLSDQIARDYHLSPDSTKLVFLAQEFAEGRIINRAFIADLVGRTVDPLPAEGLMGGDILRPLWHPGGSSITVGTLPSGAGPAPVALVPLDGEPPSFLPGPEIGFDIPLSWAPDGSYLAVASSESSSLVDPGKRLLVLVAPTGHRLIVAEGPDVEVVGWVTDE
jgi:hypothetical protein